MRGFKILNPIVLRFPNLVSRLRPFSYIFSGTCTAPESKPYNPLEVDSRTGGRTPVRSDLLKKKIKNPDDAPNVGIGGIKVPPIFVKEFKELDYFTVLKSTPLLYGTAFTFTRRNISSFSRACLLHRKLLLSVPL